MTEEAPQMPSSFFLDSRQYVTAYANCGIELLSVYADVCRRPCLTAARVGSKNERTKPECP